MLLSVFFPILPGAVSEGCVMMRKNGAKLAGVVEPYQKSNDQGK